MGRVVILDAKVGEQRGTPRRTGIFTKEAREAGEIVRAGALRITQKGRGQGCILSTRWLAAEVQAPASSEYQQSISMNPVTGSTYIASLMRPDTGVQPSATENSRIAISPHQKIGMEAPVTETLISP